jgi:hypothetical protein
MAVLMVFFSVAPAWVADVQQDFIENVLQQRRVPGQHKTGGGKGDHQDRDHRQKRKVGDGRAKLISQPSLKRSRAAGAQSSGCAELFPPFR